MKENRSQKPGARMQNKNKSDSPPLYSGSWLLAPDFCFSSFIFSLLFAFAPCLPDVKGKKRIESLVHWFIDSMTKCFNDSIPFIPSFRQWLKVLWSVVTAYSCAGSGGL
jgi:hypothetical protein